MLQRSQRRYASDGCRDACQTDMKNNHLLWRAGFGPAYEQLSVLRKASHLQIYDALEKASRKEPMPIEVAENFMKGLSIGIGEASKMQMRDLSDEQKKNLRKQSREGIRSLNLRWLGEMVNSNAQLREKMAFFWHGHFACRNLNVFYQQQLLQVIRKHALANFGELLREVSKSSAMINFLNNNQNRKGHPNENFARELLELFTLGRGEYSEIDVRESARAFTGWGANLQGEFVFRPFQHDNGSKFFLGKEGNFTGDDIIDILVQKKETAYFITRKLYRFFVNEKDDIEKIGWLAGRFYQSGYDISSLLRDMFTSNWFYEEANMGNRIKSPIELLVGLQRQIPITVSNEQTLLLAQRLLGQVLFFPPNVAGWPGGRSWIDSSSLLLRLRIPELIIAGKGLNMRPKTDDDQQMGRTIASSVSTGFSSVKWDKFQSAFSDTARPDLAKGISTFILQTNSSIDTAMLLKYTDQSTRASYIKSLTITLLACPEYQLH